MSGYKIENMPKVKGMVFRKWAIEELKKNGVVFYMHKYTNKTLLKCLKMLERGVSPADIGFKYSARGPSKNKIPKTNDYKTPRISSKEFYNSDEWKRLRYQALKIHGPRCQCCGATPINGIVIHVDHIKPRSLYPELQLDITNLQILCEPCNIGKSNLDETDWR